MHEKLHPELLNELLKISGDYIHHREGQELEFKEQFSLSGLADYFKDFAAFANNRGGYLIFGIKDSPRFRTGLNEKSLEQFDKLDPEKITGYLLEYFSCEIRWQLTTHHIKEKSFGVFYIHECKSKPVIAKKDVGKENVIKNGDIYYRYGGRTQKILFAELESIINQRIQSNTQQFLDLVKKVGKAGPANAAVFDMKTGTIAKDNNSVLVVDEDLLSKMTFIKEGEFHEVKGAKTLKLVGDVQAVDTVEVVKKVKENLIKEYPFSARELIEDVKRKINGIKELEIYDALKENKIRGNPTYSAYNFRTKKHEDIYLNTGAIPGNTPCLFNFNAIEFLLKVLKSKRK
jgi:hypothetical protein